MFLGELMLVLITVTVASSITHLIVTTETNTGVLQDNIVVLIITQMDELLFSGLDVVASTFGTEYTQDADSVMKLMKLM